MTDDEVMTAGDAGETRPARDSVTQAAAVIGSVALLLALFASFAAWSVFVSAVHAAPADAPSVAALEHLHLRMLLPGTSGQRAALFADVPWQSPTRDRRDLLSLGRTADRAKAARAQAVSDRLNRLYRIDLTRYAGTVVKQGKRSTGMVALTFDDGPSNNTLEIVRILKAAGARATFFFVGNRLEGRVVGPRAVIAEGSEIGNHTYTHRSLKGVTPQVFAAEVLRTQQLDERLFGLRPTLLRARGGVMDDASEKMATDAGLVVVDWNKTGQDTVPEAEPDYIASHAERARGGSIVLFHETRNETVKALPRIIKALQDRGLQLVTVSELLAASD